MKKRNGRSLSASSIGSFKACPQRFRYAYVEGLRPLEDSESQRVGTNWHSCLEMLLNGGSIEDVSDFLDGLYENVSPAAEEKASIERTILLYSICGWLHRWEDEPLETVATELKFELPLTEPRTGIPVIGAKVVGKIDRVSRRGNAVLITEHKSTSKSIASDSTYWDGLRMDVQISTYFDAIGRLLPQEPVNGVLYDVWHKPTIRPKKLTQADSKAFVETGDYMGGEFHVTGRPMSDEDPLEVDGERAEIEPGKKDGTYAVRETLRMFGWRLLVDMQERPDFYFARREVGRSTADMVRHRWELLHIWRAMKWMEESGAWWCNGSQCEATFKCPYMGLCYRSYELREGETPEGFKRIYSDASTEED